MEGLGPKRATGLPSQPCLKGFNLLSVSERREVVRAIPILGCKEALEMQDSGLACISVLEHRPCVSSVREPNKGGERRRRYGLRIELLKDFTISFLPFVTRPLGEIEGWRQDGFRKRCLSNTHLIQLPGTLELASKPGLRRQASFRWKLGGTQAWALT
jgi:hypothetical protein